MFDYNTEQNILLDRLLLERPSAVVDLGAGLARHTGYLLERGARVWALDFALTDNLRQIASQYPGRAHLISADMTHLPFANKTVEVLWASHSLEHTDDPITVLREWRRVLRPGGILAIVVPPFKTEVVGRHVFSGWTVGQLMLTLLRAGFDIRTGAYRRHLYNVCAIVRRDENPLRLRPNDEILCEHTDRFPPPIQEQIRARKRVNPFGETISSFEGDIQELNW
jgi:ubiquinone/menaquinone biosynthesis C-methylase UbiE